jgi:protein-tyrosine-phosphatase
MLIKTRYRRTLTMRKKLILTVCSGNIHRSVIAQLCLNRELVNIGRETEFEVLSRGLQGTMGTGAPKYSNLLFYEMEYRHTQPCLKEIGIEIPINQKATPIDEAIVERASLILVMDEKVLHSLERRFPKCIFKMRLFVELVGKKEDVPDCSGVDDATFYRQVVMSINEVAKAGIHTMIQWIGLQSEQNIPPD